MRIKGTVTLGCAALLIAAAPAWAQNLGDGLEPEPDQSTTRVGTRGAAFLGIPVGARYQALGGSGVALVNGVESLAWNVASAAAVDQFSAGWSYAELYEDSDITHQFAGIILPLGQSSVGLSLISLASGDIIRTSERFPEGGDPQFGPTFDFNSIAVQGTFARAITDRLNVGAGLKFVSEGIDAAKANWVGVDIGALFRTGLFGMTIGATIQNLGGEASYSGNAIRRVVSQAQDAFPTGDNVPINFATDELTLPTAFRFSALLDLTGSPEAILQTIPQEQNVRLLVDIYDGIDTALEPSFGLEYSYREIVFGRVGKRFFNEGRADFRGQWDALSFGGGLRVPVLGRQLGFDYAYTRMGLLENVQTISLSLGT